MLTELEEAAGTFPYLLDGLAEGDWVHRHGRPIRLGKNPTKPKSQNSHYRRGRRQAPGAPPTARSRPCVGPSCPGLLQIMAQMWPLLAIEPAIRSADAVERVWIVDGTLIPVRDRKTGASSRNYRFSVNRQVVINADTELLVAVARPVPGNTADARAWRDSTWRRQWSRHGQDEDHQSVPEAVQRPAVGSLRQAGPGAGQGGVLGHLA